MLFGVKVTLRMGIQRGPADDFTTERKPLKRFITAGALGALGLGLIPGTAGATPAPKVSVCHATGSATNPFVLITVSENAWLNAHSDHEGDVLATEIEVVVDVEDGREKTETIRFCPGPAPIPGPQGPAGPQGPPGNPGLGFQGPAGPAGAAGIPGRNGKDGADGQNGLDGLNGADGLNAVQHKCLGLDGYLYSADKCLPLSVVGEAGPQGERGEIGPAGPQGSAGGTTVLAANDTAPTVAPAHSVPVGELAHTGNNDWMYLGVGLVLVGALAFGVRKYVG